jgi:PHD/YefM family antitoxin component YafN of YafNO toxin-antitoxin module
MTVRKTLDDVRANFDATLNTVRCEQQPVLIEEDGQPVAAILTPEQFEEWQAYAKKLFFEAVRELQAANADKDPDEVYRDVTEIVEEVRQERYEREQQKLARDH